MKTFKIETNGKAVVQPMSAILPFIPQSATPYTIEMALEDCAVGATVDWFNHGEQVKATRVADIKPNLYCRITGSAMGSSEMIPLTTLNDASAAYRAFCETNGLGASEAGQCRIYANGKQVAYVSYNGKVWEGTGRNWTADKQPIFNPYPQEKLCTA